MSLDMSYPALTAMLDRYLRGHGESDEHAVESFVAAEGDEAREEVLGELRALRSSGHDEIELHMYLMTHRFDMLPEGGAEAWLASLEALLERAF